MKNLRIATVLAKIWTKHLLNMSLQCYCYANLLSSGMLLWSYLLCDRTRICNVNYSILSYVISVCNVTSCPHISSLKKLTSSRKNLWAYSPSNVSVYAMRLANTINQ
jgi:hypothetical protein